LAPPAAAQTTSPGTWTRVNESPAGFGLWLLTDGTVLSHGQNLNNWRVLVPDKTGSYANGTWKTVASDAHARGGAQQHVLKDGRFFQAGGEYVDGPACTPALCIGAEIFDPVANTWTVEANALWDVGDTGSATLGDGRILDSTRANSMTQIYDPAKNTWTAGPANPIGSGDENAWASLQNGGVLAVGYATAGAAIYDPATNTWTKTGPMPAGFDTGDTGGISLMFDGRVYVYGLAGKSYIYTPGPTAADPGTWALGPAMLNGLEAEDEYSDTLPNGMVMGALVAQTYGAGVALQEFDPTNNTVIAVTPPPDTNSPYPISYVNLPNGQVMITTEDFSANYLLTPNGGPQDAWRPTVTSVVFQGGTTYTLTGTQLSGLINGGDEGDDMTMAENYPIVWLKDAAGDVYYCRSFNFSNMLPSKGSAPETCQFTTPAGLPDGTYDLYVSAVGVPSKDPFPFTTGQSSDAGAPDSGTASDAGPDAPSGADASTHDGGTGSGSSGGSSGGSGSSSSSGAGGGSGSSGSSGAAGGGDAGTGDGATGATSGCGCAAVGDHPSSRAAWAAALCLLGIVVARARRRMHRR
jgi:hypothetical protein